MTPNDLDAAHFWHLLTRLGEIQILLPAALLVSWAIVRHADTRPMALRWGAGLVISTAVTTASKVAFIGWGLGIAALNFTGFSGHAMFAAAIYPMLFGILAARLQADTQKLSLAMGIALAILVGISRVVVGAHSVSEVVSGLLLGGAVSWAAMAPTRLPRLHLSPLVPALVLVWLLVSPAQVPPSQSHSLVVRLSLALSGNAASHTRTEMLRKSKSTGV